MPLYMDQYSVKWSSWVVHLTPVSRMARARRFRDAIANIDFRQNIMIELIKPSTVKDAVKLDNELMNSLYRGYYLFLIVFNPHVTYRKIYPYLKMFVDVRPRLFLNTVVTATYYRDDESLYRRLILKKGSKAEETASKFNLYLGDKLVYLKYLERFWRHFHVKVDGDRLYARRFDGRIYLYSHPYRDGYIIWMVKHNPKPVEQGIWLENGLMDAIHLKIDGEDMHPHREIMRFEADARVDTYILAYVLEELIDSKLNLFPSSQDIIELIKWGG